MLNVHIHVVGYGHERNLEGFHETSEPKKSKQSDATKGV